MSSPDRIKKEKKGYEGGGIGRAEKTDSTLASIDSLIDSLGVIRDTFQTG